VPGTIEKTTRIGKLFEGQASADPLKHEFERNQLLPLKGFPAAGNGNRNFFRFGVHK